MNSYTYEPKRKHETQKKELLSRREQNPAGKVVLGGKTETEAIDAALDLVIFKRHSEVAGKGGWQRGRGESLLQVAKHLLDSDLYIDLIRIGETLPVIRELYQQDAPGNYFSSVVAQELRTGA